MRQRAPTANHAGTQSRGTSQGRAAICTQHCASTCILHCAVFASSRRRGGRAIIRIGLEADAEAAHAFHHDGMGVGTVMICGHHDDDWEWRGWGGGVEMRPPPACAHWQPHNYRS